MSDTQHTEHGERTPEQVQSLRDSFRALAGAFHEMEMPSRNHDRLDELFRMQSKLNDLAFEKNQLVNHKGTQLTMRELVTAAQQAKETGSCSVNSLTNEWVRRYTQALGAEVKEVEELIPVKFWSKSKLDLPHLHEEIIDSLHFWISLALVSGLDADAVMDTYREKYRVNVERQLTNYTARGDMA